MKERQQRASVAASATATSGVLQRRCACGTHVVGGGECAECREQRLQRATSGPQVAGEAPPIVHEVLRSPGQPLDAGTRAALEPRFGHDFSAVRVHTDSKAAESAGAVNALAYTVGRDVVFGAGQYTPQTNAGQRLLAHELTHVVQQRFAADSGGAPLLLDDPHSEQEQEAQRAAQRIARGAAPRKLMAQARIQRDATTDAPPAETAEARLRRQAQTVIEVLSKTVADADASGYGGVKLTIRHTGDELIPGFEKLEPIQPRPSGTIPRLTSTVASELKPALDMLLLAGKGDWQISYRRNKSGYMALESQTHQELPAKPPVAAPPVQEQKQPETPAPDPLEKDVLQDCERVITKLNVTWYSDNDEKTVMDILYRWAFVTNPPNFAGKGSFYLQSLFDCLAARATSDAGVSYYNRLFTRSDDFKGELKELRNYRAPARATGSDLKDDEVSFELADAPAAKDVSTTLSFLSNDQKRVLGWLQQHKADIASAEARFKIDRRAIAGAIAWEALENVRGSWTPSSVGPGKVHIRTHRIAGEETAAKQVEDAGLLPQATFDERKKTLATAPGAISYIAAIMKAGADIAFEEKGFEISKDPPILCFMYQTDDLPKWRERMRNKAAGTQLDPGASMGLWVKVHQQFLEEAVGQPAFEPEHPKPAKGGVQKASLDGLSGSPAAWGSVPLALASPAIGLAAPLREQMSRLFQHSFDTVRVHDNQIAASSAHHLHARAYAVGHDLVFGANEYQPQTAAGRRLIAHELTHVVQQTRHQVAPVGRWSQPGDPAEAEADRMADAAVAGEQSSSLRPHAQPSGQVMRQQASQGPTWGTAKTTAPVAKLSPRKEMLGQLTDEVALFSNAQLIIDWVIKKSTPKPSGGAPPAASPLYSFSLAELLGTTALVKKLRPAAKNEDDFKATIGLMQYYGAVIGPIALSRDGSDIGYLLPVDAKTDQPDLGRFTTAKQSVGQFTERFGKRQQRPSPLDPVVETSVLPPEMSAGSAGERKPEKQAADELAKLRDELAALGEGESDDDAKKRAALEEKIAKVQERLRIASGYHTFAVDVTKLLVRLRKLNTSWTAGTYVGHSWGEFSADIFLSAGLITVNDADEYSGKYWDRDVVRTFFDDLNTVAEEDDPEAGKFAWRAIYNDKPLAQEINQKFGAGRVIHADNHGPAPDHKLHIHLDLRPLTLRLDTKSGYQVNDGRVTVQ